MVPRILQVHILDYLPMYLLLYTGAMMQRPRSGQALYMDRSALNHPYRDSTVTIRTASRMQLQITYIIFAQQVTISLLANVSLPKFTDPFPYQENIEQDWRLLPYLCQLL